MEGFVVKPAGTTPRIRRRAWKIARWWGVEVKHFYLDRDQAEKDAKAATELSGIRFEVREAEGI